MAKRHHTTAQRERQKTWGTGQKSTTSVDVGGRPAVSKIERHARTYSFERRVIGRGLRSAYADPYEMKPLDTRQAYRLLLLGRILFRAAGRFIFCQLSQRLRGSDSASCWVGNLGLFASDKTLSASAFPFPVF